LQRTVQLQSDGACHRGEPVLAVAPVRVGALKFSAYLFADGRVALPAELDDERIQREISARLRELALTELSILWIATTLRGESRKEDDGLFGFPNVIA